MNSLAYIIGINIYSEQHQVPKLRTPVNDASELAEVLRTEFGFTTVCLLDHNAKLADLKTLFEVTIPRDLQSLGEDSRVLIYFAGHGIVTQTPAEEDGGQTESYHQSGYLLPQDAGIVATLPEDPLHAEQARLKTFLPMSVLQAWLNQLPCRHLLLILDCCFAGAFQFAPRELGRVITSSITQERLDHFLRHPARQLITSAAYHERAQDETVAGKALGRRGIVITIPGQSLSHSPFAQALLDALRNVTRFPGETPADMNGDGVLTPQELIGFVETRMLRDAEALRDGNNLLSAPYQTPQLLPLPGHGQGQFALRRLKAPSLQHAVKLHAGLNPYRGLQSYGLEHAKTFFGRDEEISRLITHLREHPLVILAGASGSGKSSLAAAGVLHQLEKESSAPDSEGFLRAAWCLLPAFRPGLDPVQGLHAALLQTEDDLDHHRRGHRDLELTNAMAAAASFWEWQPDTLADLITQWQRTREGTKLLITVDQAEELVAITRDAGERSQFIQLLLNALKQYPDHLRVLFTLRTDFELQLFTEMERASNDMVGLRTLWSRGRIAIAPMTNSQIKQTIQSPAATVDLFFETSELVEQLVSEVANMPGALPLLSFTLERMFHFYLKNGSGQRELTWQEYWQAGNLRPGQMGTVVSALRNRAEEIFQGLPDDAHRATMRRLMLRMVATEGGELARRRAYQVELTYELPPGSKFGWRDIEDPLRFLDWINQKENPISIVLESQIGNPAGISQKWFNLERTVTEAKAEAKVDFEVPQNSRFRLGRKFWLWQQRLALGLLSLEWASRLNRWLLEPRHAVALAEAIPVDSDQQLEFGIHLTPDSQELLDRLKATDGHGRRPQLTPTFLADLCPALRTENQRVAFVQQRLLQERLLVSGREDNRRML